MTNPRAFDFISSDGRQTGYRCRATGQKVSLDTTTATPRLTSYGAMTTSLLRSFNDWRMAKYITDIGTMQANAAKYGYDDPAQIARDYPAPTPARGLFYRDGQMHDIEIERQQAVCALIEHDRAQWSQPSNRAASAGPELERAVEAVTGEPCPAWPRRNA